MTCRDLWIPGASTFETSWLDAPTFPTHSCPSVQMFWLDADDHMVINCLPRIIVPCALSARHWTEGAYFKWCMSYRTPQPLTDCDGNLPDNNLHLVICDCFLKVKFKKYGIGYSTSINGYKISSLPFLFEQYSADTTCKSTQLAADFEPKSGTVKLRSSSPWPQWSVVNNNDTICKATRREARRRITGDWRQHEGKMFYQMST